MRKTGGQRRSGRHFLSAPFGSFLQPSVGQGAGCTVLSPHSRMPECRQRATSTLWASKVDCDFFPLGLDSPVLPLQMSPGPITPKSLTSAFTSGPLTGCLPHQGSASQAYTVFSDLYLGTQGSCLLAHPAGRHPWSLLFCIQ